MRFQWDPPKAIENLRKHRISFEEACTIFADRSILTIPDDEHSKHEERWVSMGISRVGRILVTIHTWPEPDNVGEEWLRIVSARRANKRERAEYLERKR